jgi:hypothetical protein
VTRGVATGVAVDVTAFAAVAALVAVLPAFVAVLAAAAALSAVFFLRRCLINHPAMKEPASCNSFVMRFPAWSCSASLIASDALRFGSVDEKLEAGILASSAVCRTMQWKLRVVEL